MHQPSIPLFQYWILTKFYSRLIFKMDENQDRTRFKIVSTSTAIHSMVHRKWLIDTKNTRTVPAVVNFVSSDITIYSITTLTQISINMDIRLTQTIYLDPGWDFFELCYHGILINMDTFSSALKCMSNEAVIWFERTSQSHVKARFPVHWKSWNSHCHCGIFSHPHHC